MCVLFNVRRRPQSGSVDGHGEIWPLCTMREKTAPSTIGMEPFPARRLRFVMQLKEKGPGFDWFFESSSFGAIFISSFAAFLLQLLEWHQQSRAGMRWEPHQIRGKWQGERGVQSDFFTACFRTAEFGLGVAG